MGSRSKGDTRRRPQTISRPRQSPSSPIAIAGPGPKTGQGRQDAKTSRKNTVGHTISHTNYKHTHTHTHTHTYTQTDHHTPAQEHAHACREPGVPSPLSYQCRPERAAPLT